MSRRELDDKVVRQQAKKIRLISKGLVKGSRFGLTHLALLNSPQTLVVTGHQCKVTMGCAICLTRKAYPVLAVHMCNLKHVS